VNFLGEYKIPDARLYSRYAPNLFSCQAIVNPGGLFEMSHVRFQNIMPMRM